MLPPGLVVGGVWRRPRAHRAGPPVGETEGDTLCRPAGSQGQRASRDAQSAVAYHLKWLTLNVGDDPAIEDCQLITEDLELLDVDELAWRE